MLRPKIRTRLRAMIRRREEAFAAEGDDEKVVTPFEWGLADLGLPEDAPDPFAAIVEHNRRVIADPAAFFALPSIPEFTLHEDNHVTWPTALPTAEPENNTVHATFHPTAKRKRAVVLMGHWNAKAAAYDRLGRALAKSGTGVLRVSMPYHDERIPAGWGYARDFVCANAGRTIRSNRQGVLDARAGLEFLLQQGYHRIGTIGASAGASIATLAAAFEPRAGALACLHIASHFGEAIYNGRASRHIREAMGEVLDCAGFNAMWDVISPISYLPQFQDRALSILFISGKFDQVFRPYLSAEMAAAFQRAGIDFDWRRLPCGHFTLGTFPFSTYVGAAAMRFFKRALDRGVAPRARTDRPYS